MCDDDDGGGGGTVGSTDLSFSAIVDFTQRLLIDLL